MLPCSLHSNDYVECYTSRVQNILNMLHTVLNHKCSEISNHGLCVLILGSREFFNYCFRIRSVFYWFKHFAEVYMQHYRHSDKHIIIQQYSSYVLKCINIYILSKNWQDFLMQSANKVRLFRLIFVIQKKAIDIQRCVIHQGARK